MWILVLCLIAIAVTAACAELLTRNKGEKGQPATGSELQQSEPGTGQECCGQHAICEKESLLAAVSRKIEYYDDEELDRLQGIPSDKYTREEEEEFRNVFYTMLPEDVAGWIRSLQLRGIALPDSLKDEVLLIVSERRTDHPVT